MGYRLAVERAQFGTEERTDHPDNCEIAKFNVQLNASFISGVDLDANGELDSGGAGISNASADVNIGVAKFGGDPTTNDFLILSDNEIVSIEERVSTDVQSIIVTDGSTTDPETTFKVFSTSGNTEIRGSLKQGTGLDRFTIDVSGNTVTQGTLTTNNTLKIRGNVVEDKEFFTITNGGATGTTERTTLEVDTATGDLDIMGGDLTIWDSAKSTKKLFFNNSSGDLTITGKLSATGSGQADFGGDMVIAGDLTVNGGDLTVNQGGTTIFKVENNKTLTIAGIDNFFSSSGGRKWVYSNDVGFTAEANVNYFLDISANTVVKLPQTPKIGDMIRFIDIGGLLSYNLSLVVRAYQNTRVQNTDTNTGNALLSGNSTSLTGYTGGELVVQTPNAGFALVYAGAADDDGNGQAPTSKVGWFLVEV